MPAEEFASESVSGDSQLKEGGRRERGGKEERGSEKSKERGERESFVHLG